MTYFWRKLWYYFFMEIYESGENYLETILVLEGRLGVVRSVDVAAELGFSKPSISRAMGRLAESGYIVMSRGSLQLTEAGREKALAIYERHMTIATYLERALGVCPEVAEGDACKIEHVLSDEAFCKIKDWVSSN
jgi:Mn-dependent DtxR family transcriptional regulator